MVKSVFLANGKHLVPLLGSRTRHIVQRLTLVEEHVELFTTLQLGQRELDLDLFARLFLAEGLVEPSCGILVGMAKAALNTPSASAALEPGEVARFLEQVEKLFQQEQQHWRVRIRRG